MHETDARDQMHGAARRAVESIGDLRLLTDTRDRLLAAALTGENIGRDGDSRALTDTVLDRASGYIVRAAGRIAENIDLAWYHAEGEDAESLSLLHTAALRVMERVAADWTLLADQIAAYRKTDADTDEGKVAFRKVTDMRNYMADYTGDTTDLAYGLGRVVG